MIVSDINVALYISIGLTLAALFAFGFIKAIIFGVSNRLSNALHMTVVGAAAAGAAFGVAKLLPE